MSDDIVDKMIEAWNEPFSTDHDPRELLVLGAKEIRSLRSDLDACAAMVHLLHSANVRMAAELRARMPSPNAPLYVIVAMAVVMAVLAIVSAL